MTSGGARESIIPYLHLIRISGAFAAGAGFIALLGWALGLPFLATLGSGNIPMAPSTAGLLVLYGVAAVLRARLPLHRGAYWLVVVIHCAGALIALLLFFLSYQGIYLEAEHLGFTAVGVVGGALIGHMSPATALGFLVASLSFLASLPSSSNRPWRAVMAWWWACLLLAACFALLLAYLYGTPLLYGGSFIPPAATTSVAFAALGVALLALAGPQAWPHGKPGAATTHPVPVLFLAFVLLAAGIITAGYLYFRAYEAHYRVEVERQLSAVAELTISELVHFRNERLGDASMFLQNAGISKLVQQVVDDPGDGEAQAQLQVWLGKYQAHDQYARVVLLDAQGAVRMSVPESPVPIASVVSQRAAESLRSGEIVFQDFYLDEHDQRVYLTLLVPVLAAPDSGRALGVIALQMDPDTYLNSFIGHWPTPSETAETLLTRRDGNDALILSKLRFQENTALTIRVALDRQDVLAVKAVLGQEGIVEGVDYRGVPAIADVRAVPDSPWFLVARMDLSEVYAPLRQRMWMTVVLVGALLIGAGTAVGMVWRQQRARFYRERYEAERERAWLQDVIARSVNEIYVFDPETLRFSFANAGACCNIGYTPDELARLTPLDIHPKFTEEAFRTMVQPLRTGERTVLVFETVCRRKDGSEYPVGVHLQHVDAAGGPVFLAIISDITERQRAEADRRVSDDRHRAVVQSAKDAIISADSAGSIVGWNPGAEKMFGYRESEIIGQPLTLLMPHHDRGRSPQEYRDRYDNGMARLESGGEPHVISRTVVDGLEGLRKDGSVFPLEFSLAQWEIHDSQFFTGIIRDITERKAAEEALRLFRTLLDRSTDAIEVLDPETGRYLDVNEKGCLDIGCSRDEFLALRVFDVDPMVDQAVFARSVKDLRKSGALMWESIHRRKDGSTFPVEVHISHVQIDREYLVCVVRDIGERKRAEQALHESQLRLSGIVDSAMDGIVTVDEAERIVVFNAAAGKMFGCSAVEAIGQPLERFIPERFRAAHHGHVLRFGQTGDTQRTAAQCMHISGQRANGEEFPIEASISRTEVNGHLLFTVILRDVTEQMRSEEARTQLEAKLRHAQKMDALGTLAAGIAHDFNNILAAIIGNAELAQQDVGSGHPAMASLSEIRKATRRARDMVQRILAFGRPQLEAPTVIALRPVVEEAVALLRATLPAGIEVAAAFDADTPAMRADPSQIHQITMNLCTNAWHAIHGPVGRIDIRLDGVMLDAEAASANSNLSPGRFARLCVTDNGSGMDAATLEHIFEPFFTTKPVGQSTGLGLSVVHGIVEAHGGVITVTSQPGTGTTFSVYFPAAEAAQPRAAPEDAAAAPLLAAGGQHVLYLDDEESLVFLVTRTLERLGYRVSGYTRSEDALAAVRTDPGQFDLVVSDLNMPGLSGLEVARELARLRPDLPVVLTSGSITDDLRAAASKAGVRELIYKPNMVEDLCEVVRRLAGERIQA